MQYELFYLVAGSKEGDWLKLKKQLKKSSRRRTVFLSPKKPPKKEDWLIKSSMKAMEFTWRAALLWKTRKKCTP